mgnify:FL=1
MEGIILGYDQSNITVYIESDGAFDPENGNVRSPWRRFDRHAIAWSPYKTVATPSSQNNNFYEMKWVISIPISV